VPPPNDNSPCHRHRRKHQADNNSSSGTVDKTWFLPRLSVKDAKHCGKGVFIQRLAENSATQYPCMPALLTDKGHLHFNGVDDAASPHARITLVMCADDPGRNTHSVHRRIRNRVVE